MVQGRKRRIDLNDVGALYRRISWKTCSREHLGGGANAEQHIATVDGLCGLVPNFRWQVFAKPYDIRANPSAAIRAFWRSHVGGVIYTLRDTRGQSVRPFSGKAFIAPATQSH